MADPTLYPTPILSENDIRKITLPPGLKPQSIQLLNDVAAGYHRLYQVTFDPEELSQYIPPAVRDTSRDDSLILRIAGKHFTTIKSVNEIDTISYASVRTRIPVPSVLWCSEDDSNSLGHEYMYLTHAKGQSFDILYHQLQAASDQDQLELYINSLLPQVADILIELVGMKWSFVGGLRRNIAHARTITDTVNPKALDFIGGPQLDEQFWHEPEFDQFWDGRAKYLDLNPGGPFSSWTELELAKIERYVWMIEHHESLQPIRQHLPRVRDLSAAIRQYAAEINDTSYILAHRDLHMGNIIYDLESRKITAVIDWEFAAVVPAPRADANLSNLLWDCSPSGISESTRDMQLRLKEICRGRGIDMEAETRYRNPRQEAMMDAVNYLRAVTEVLPRGQLGRNWKGWVKAMLAAVDTLCRDDLGGFSSVSDKSVGG